MIPGGTIEGADDLRALALHMEEAHIGHRGTQMVVVVLGVAGNLLLGNPGQVDVVEDDDLVAA